MPTLDNPALESFAQHFAVSRSTPLASAAAGLPLHLRASDRPEVVARVQEIWGLAMASADLTPEMVMRELKRIAMQDIRPIFDADGNLKPIHMLDDDTAATIASVDVEVKWQGKGDDAVPITTKKVRRVDKMAALGILARHFKIVGDDNEGVNALASALAERLKSARNRTFARDAEDARIIEPPRVIDSTSAARQARWAAKESSAQEAVPVSLDPNPTTSNSTESTHEQLW